MKEDHRRLYRQLLQLRKESLKKKIKACTGFESLTSAIQRSSAPVRCTSITEVKGSNPTYIQVRT